MYYTELFYFFFYPHKIFFNLGNNSFFPRCFDLKSSEFNYSVINIKSIKLRDIL